MALGDADDVDHLVLGKDICNLDLLLKETHDKVNLLLRVPTVHLDLLDVRLLLANLHFADLRVAHGADHLAVLFGSLDLSLHGRALLARLRPSLLVLGEGLLLALVPVLVEAALALLAEVPGPDARQGAEPARRLDVAHEAHDDHGRRLHDGHALGDLLLVQLGPGLVDVPDDVRHPGLVGHEGGEVRGLRLVVLGEALDLAVVVLGALPRQEAEGAVARALELAVRHGEG
mmetsp:Transcript_81367/g.256581  ORF Transcript_81367/g.256581 Transcript_81367/m.256581 type:complete len:231 (+) Transcript_81367:685-1377(+)